MGLSCQLCGVQFWATVCSCPIGAPDIGEHSPFYQKSVSRRSRPDAAVRPCCKKVFHAKVRGGGVAMIRAAARVKFLATGLAALAGFVDATGFIKLGGFFVSVMSGNNTRLAVGLARQSQPAVIACGLVPA